MQIRGARMDDLAPLLALERASYPADEAASEEMLRYRLERAREFIRLGEDDGALIGFVCGTRIEGTELTQESMHVHVERGPLLCIHSVVVDEARRRSGLGTALMREYMRFVGTTDVQRVALIAKQHLVGFYRGCGFELVGPSPVVHGRERWFELQRSL